MDEEDRDESEYTRARKKEKIRPQDTGNRATSPHYRYLRVGRKYDMRCGRPEAAQNVEK